MQRNWFVHAFVSLPWLLKSDLFKICIDKPLHKILQITSGPEREIVIAVLYNFHDLAVQLRIVF